MEQKQRAKKQIDLISESICVEIQCLHCLDLHKKGELCFSIIEEFIDDRGRSCLFRLKEMCHDLFRNSNYATYKEKLYDITVGYTFHEAMKLRENLYQLEYYRPRSDVALEELTEQDTRIVREMGTLLRKAERKLQEGLREIMVLSKQLLVQLKDLMRLYQDNYLLPRFLYENEKLCVRVFGRKGLDNLLDDLFHGGRPRLIQRAAESYLSSEYYEKARLLFKKVWMKDRSDDEALFFYYYSSAYHYFYKNRPTRAHAFAKKAYFLTLDNVLWGTFRRNIEGLMAELEQEVKNLKGSTLSKGE